MTTAYPGIAFEQHGQPLSIQRFKCILDENEGEQQQSSGQGSQASAAARRGFDMNRAYSTRSARQACIALEGIIEGSSEAITGPRVTFVTNSISQIIDADSSDIQGLPFLSLVATEDITKAAAFLDNALSSNELVLENFRLLADPVDPNSRRSRELVSAEFMAMASDDGVNILCQLGKNESARRGPAGRYMSLDEIISSDPETSGFSEAWNRFSLR
ncbi:hypothetical protein GGI12_006170 [Dipsacomyces acuminosporus]|nr:hypothetical protein GGI12_006170 [Dipsacomyces acuminosporus]